VGGWQPRQPRRRNRQLDCFAEFIERRAPEVGFNAVVLHRELQALGFPGGLMQVRVSSGRPRTAQVGGAGDSALRDRAGEQAQVDYGQLWVWIGLQPEKVHLFVFSNWVTKYISPDARPNVQNRFRGRNRWGAWGRRQQRVRGRCTRCWSSGSEAA
jgi:hypothetical protein